jgi:hypothetical protein
VGSIDKRTNIVVSRNVGASGSHQSVTSVQHAPIDQDGSARSRDKAELSPAEIEAQQADDLPDREAMTLITGPLPPTIAPLEPGAPGLEHTMPVTE